MEEKNRNVLSWHQAFEKGFSPLDYPFQTESVPIGEFAPTLDFEIWAKKSIVSRYNQTLANQITSY